MKPEVVGGTVFDEVERIRHLARRDRAAALKEACRDFEAFFIYQLLKDLRRTIPKGDFLPQAPGKEVYQSLFDQEVAREISQSGGLGLADVLYQQLLPSIKEEKHGR